MLTKRSVFEPSVWQKDELYAEALTSDERLWVPASQEGAWLRPLLFDTTQGMWVNITRICKEGFISRHAHPSPVHGMVLKGSWYYAERNWVATEGTYVYEPPGDVHTLMGTAEESYTLFVIHGTLVELDEDGKPIKYGDVFNRLEQAADHFERVGLGRDYVKQFVR